MYLYFSSVEQFDFSEMLDKTIKNYSPNDMKAEKKEELISQLKKQGQTLYGIKLLLLRYVEAPERKTRKKLLDMLGKAREREAELLKEVIMTIENRRRRG